MKNIYILFLASFILFSCGEDDSPETDKKLATPSLSWTPTNVIDDVLEIEITITTSDDLPAGKIEFKVDNIIIDTFSAKKGNQSYTTNFKFEDVNEHTAVVNYSFTDGRSALNKSKKLKKNLIETIQKSEKEDWVTN